MGTLAAKAAKVFAPVVGGLMAPYMPEWQCYWWLSGPTSGKTDRRDKRSYRFPGAEEPDGVRGLSHFEGENADLTRGSIKRHEWGREAILLGDSVKLLGARV